MSMKIKFLTLTSLVVPALLASFAANASDGTWKSGEHIYNKVTKCVLSAMKPMAILALFWPVVT